jgi:hypothetical protein
MQDPDLTWQGDPAAAGLAVCLPPETDGSCKLCPTDEVAPTVEIRMKMLLAENRPEGPGLQPDQPAVTSATKVA